MGDLPLAGRPKKENAAALKKCLQRWSPLLLRFVQSRADHNTLLESVASLAAPSGEGGANGAALFDVFENALKLLYAEMSSPN